MRAGRLLPVLVLAAVGACGGGEDAGSVQTSPTPSPTTSTSSTESTVRPETTTSPVPAGPTTTAPTPPDASALPASWLRYGADGLYLASLGGDQLLVDRPIGWATSDGAGGVLFTEWKPGHFGPTWWLAGGVSQPVIVSEWDDPVMAARVDGRPAAAGSLQAIEGCSSDGGVHLAARILTTGDLVPVQCLVGGQDAGSEPDSFGGGLYIGVEWNAVHSSGRSTALRLVFRNDDGEVVELPTNPYPGDCSPCELTAALSPDGARLAVIHRPDAQPFRPDEYDAWLATTSTIMAELRVVDLATGETLFTRELTAGALPQWGSWFDGRYVAIGPDTFAFPRLSSGDTGDAVRTLQQLLVAQGADLEVDGAFGPATRDAVDAFHDARFGTARSTVGPDTWAELGVPTTVIDTWTGTTTELPGRVALEVILADGPPPGVVPPSAELEALAILRMDGIGPFTFGTDADVVHAWLVETLGEPDSAIVEEGVGGWPLPSCAERRFAYWAVAGLTVGFTDLISDDDPAGTIANCADAPRLAGWYVADEGPPWFAPGHGDVPSTPPGLWVSTEDGIGLGATAGDLRAEEPGLEFGDWDIDEYAPATFEMVTGMRGRVAWDPVFDVQRALNERGAELAVDGTFGPRTRAALTEFQSTNGIDENGIGPLTLDALDVEAPDAAPIVYLSAGRWDWSY